ncbi:saccharopine dehydrogenase NADP-binding domain-containing protein [Streptomyces sp. DSM 110735]|uniref:saccharopine dehydrogenase family protein n=1 Tax=Streptomyces sp. DSM 110735 TaxID=2775031 RepID=UPI0018F3D3B5|nr:saccharopine dehydrogenase NADP-binding domain-containing protein [Streptomyces sp. DSM 110735]MBJ7902480.1 saccharopine dehydrogenase NADP-binding domain-containing protein [Streptomyces sp. DSM 110735]
MSSRILLLGATGYTGGLVLNALLRRGVRPTLAGRNATALAALAERSGGLDHVVVDATDTADLKRHLRRGDVLVTTVGPFERLGHSAAAAAAETGAHYVDSTGEVGFVRTVRDRYGERARETGAVMLPAFGYDYVPGILAGTLAARQAGAAVRALDIGYFATGPLWRGISKGTRTTMRDGLTLPSPTWRGHRLAEERTASRVHEFDVQGRRKSAFLVSGTEVLFLPGDFPALSDVTVFNGWFPALSRPLTLISAVANALIRLPGGHHLTSLLTLPLTFGPPGGPDTTERARTRSYVVAVASTGTRGTPPLAEVRLEGPSAYSLTGELMAWAAQRLAAGAGEVAGVVGPVEAFGLEALREGCAEMGLVPEP